MLWRNFQSKLAVTLPHILALCCPKLQHHWHGSVPWSLFDKLVWKKCYSTDFLFSCFDPISVWLRLVGWFKWNYKWTNNSRDAFTSGLCTSFMKRNTNNLWQDNCKCATGHCHSFRAVSMEWLKANQLLTSSTTVLSQSQTVLKPK